MTGRALALSFLLVSAASAQLNRGSSETASRIRIRLSFPDHTPCAALTRVALIGNAGFALAETSVSGECVADFFDVPAGKYRVSVSGGDAANADDGEVEVGSLSMQDVEVHARHSGNPTGDLTSAAFVSVSDLGVPSNAAKEFGKANRMIAKQDWPNASDRLHRAVAIYPGYASAYNNLGAVYSRLGNWKEARAAFEQAIALNDHLSAAYVNLARVDFNEKDFAGAEPLLDKASNVSVPTVDELNLLAYAEIMNGHLDHAIETSRRGHITQLAHHSFLHLVAAHAYELERKITDSIDELQTYLKEEPAAPRTEEVKRAIATLQAQQSAERSVGPS